VNVSAADFLSQDQPALGAGGEEQGPTPFPEPESASAKIRARIREQILPDLQARGLDPSTKDVYPAAVRQLASEFKVTYNVAKKAWDRILREGGALPPPLPKASTKQVGGVEIEVQPSPKSPPPSPEQPPAEPSSNVVEIEGKKYTQVKLSTGQVVLKEVQETPPPELGKELMTKTFAAMHKSTGESLFRIAESAWGVKVERPADDDYTKAGELWAELVEAYHVEIPKVLMFLGAVVYTGQIFAGPILVARAEYTKKKEAEEKQKEEKKQ
jgi:hypothetical protein